MNTQQTTLLILAAAGLACCAPQTNYDSGLGREHARVPAPELNRYSKAPTGYPDPQGRTNMVVSPYRPYNIINVTGYRSGDIVGDPSTAVVNLSTGRRDPSTSKYFRIP